MKKAFTIIEVMILLTVFLIVALLVAPISLDDTAQAKNTSIWRYQQRDFENIFYALSSKLEENADLSYQNALDSILSDEIKTDIKPYKITYLNGKPLNNLYKFNDFKITKTNSVIAWKFFGNISNSTYGMLMYDVNGTSGPNIWGKDVFGYNLNKNGFEPICKDKLIAIQKQDCSKKGSGVCCSNYYLIGGSFDD